MQLAMFTNFLAYGYMMVVGFVFLIMLLQILAFYIAGKATGSIDDEITSAFTLFGALLLIGVGSTLINAGITNFFTGMVIPGAFSFIIYLVASIFAIVKIYELSIGKAILYLILSMIITAVSAGILIFVAIKLIPKPTPATNTTETSIIDTMDDETNSETDAMMFDETAEEMIEIQELMETSEPTDEPIIKDSEIMMEEPIEENTSSGPGLPGSSPQ